MSAVDRWITHTDTNEALSPFLKIINFAYTQTVNAKGLASDIIKAHTMEEVLSQLSKLPDMAKIATITTALRLADEEQRETDFYPKQLQAHKEENDQTEEKVTQQKKHKTSKQKPKKRKVVDSSDDSDSDDDDEDYPPVPPINSFVELHIDNADEYKSGTTGIARVCGESTNGWTFPVKWLWQRVDLEGWHAGIPAKGLDKLGITHTEYVASNVDDKYDRRDIIRLRPDIKMDEIQWFYDSTVNNPENALSKRGDYDKSVKVTTYGDKGDFASFLNCKVEDQESHEYWKHLANPVDLWSKIGNETNISRRKELKANEYNYKMTDVYNHRATCYFCGLTKICTFHVYANNKRLGYAGCVCVDRVHGLQKIYKKLNDLRVEHTLTPFTGQVLHEKENSLRVFIGKIIETYEQI